MFTPHRLVEHENTHNIIWVALEYHLTQRHEA